MRRVANPRALSQHLERVHCSRDVFLAIQSGVPRVVERTTQRSRCGQHGGIRSIAELRNSKKEFQMVSLLFRIPCEHARTEPTTHPELRNISLGRERERCLGCATAHVDRYRFGRGVGLHGTSWCESGRPSTVAGGCGWSDRTAAGEQVENTASACRPEPSEPRRWTELLAAALL